MKHLLLLCAVALLHGMAGAQAPEPATPAAPAGDIMARDMREEIVRVDVKVKDMYGREETKPMAITIYRPAGEGPYPVVVFNHGRAVTEKRAAQGRWRPETAARYLVAKGFVVLAPTRIGYWETYGDFDPESNGACGNLRVEPMSIAASDQVLAAIAYAKASLPYADTSRWIVAGQSVGGLTTVATVGRNPPGLLGGINFAGGSGGDPDKKPGDPCSPMQIERYWGSLAKNATVPMLWLYWPNDKYWGAESPRRWHKAWVAGGGVAEFPVFGPTGTDGHSGMVTDMDHWLPVVDAFLSRLGFDKPGIVTRPPRGSFADLKDVGKVPVSARAREAGYAKFLEARSPRAFAIGERGAYGYATGDYAMGRAVGFCQRSGQTCRLYAVDDDVVWAP
jgi:dienelactone hydrolase